MVHNEVLSLQEFEELGWVRYSEGRMTMLAMNQAGDFNDNNAKDLVKNFKCVFPDLADGGVQVKLPKAVPGLHFHDLGDVLIKVPPSQHFVRLECKCVSSVQPVIHTSSAQMERSAYWCISMSGLPPFLMYQHGDTSLLQCQAIGQNKRHQVGVKAKKGSVPKKGSVESFFAKSRVGLRSVDSSVNMKPKVVRLEAQSAFARALAQDHFKK